MLQKDNNLKSRLFETFIFSIFFVVAIIYSIGFNDSDAYYFIPVGRDILQNGFSKTNTLITTPGLHYPVQNWLWTVMIAGIYDNFKSGGLAIFHFIQIMAMAGTIFYFFKPNNKTRVFVLFIIIFLFSIFSYMNIRPQIITFILVTWTMIGLEKYRESGNWKWLILLPLTMLIEINVHASYWFMHFVFMLPYLVPDITSGKLSLKDSHIPAKKLKPVIMAMIATLMVTFINPYGLSNITYVFDSLSSGVLKKSSISEQGKWIIGDYTPIIFIVFVVVTCFLLHYKKLTTTEIYTFAGCAILFILAVKWAPFYTIGVMFVLRIIYNQFIAEADFGIDKIQLPEWFSIAGITFVIIFLATFISKSNLNFNNNNYMNNTEGTIFDGFDEIADYLDENDSNATIFASFAYENYFEFRGYKVYYDARPELYTKEIAGKDIITDTFKIMSGYDVISENKINGSKRIVALNNDDYANLVDNMNVDYYITNATEPSRYTQYLIDHPDKYECVYNGERSSLYKKIKLK